MPKTKISKAKFELIVDDIIEKVKNWSQEDITVSFKSGLRGILKNYFEIVEIDADEIGSETIGEDFAV